MKIEFFEGEDGLDQRAVFGGIYQIELGRVGMRDRILLYLGESLCILRRGNEHLSKFFEEPEYFGMTSEEVEQKDWILRFSMVEKEEETNRRRLPWQKRNALLRKREREWIKKKKPLTQSRTNDRQLDREEKRKQVHEAMEEKLSCDK